MRQGLWIAVLAVVLVGASGPRTLAQDDTEREVERYRQMLREDPWSNPGLLEADRGEALWKEKRGPKVASLNRFSILAESLADVSFALNSTFPLWR